MEKTSSNYQRYLTSKSISVFIGCILLVIIGITILLSFSNPRKNNQKDLQNDQQEEITNLSPHIIVYGSWTDNASNIYAYDLATGKEGIIASLPVDIKKISVLSPDTLIYIGHTNIRDHGREIIQYSLSSQTSTVLFQASEGFGIDDYVVSPDKKSIAIWEVQLDDASGVLLGGKSRVHTTNLSEPTIKNLIYDEQSAVNSPVHYPRAILNDGTVYLDKFLPNSGAGWAYGMSISNFTGTQKEELTSMQNGTYGTQPVLSPDGKYLAFAGYDGTKGMGNQEIGGFRRAILTPNTIELFNTSTRERIKQTNLPNTNLYTSVDWSDNQNLVVTLQSTSDKTSGSYTYNLLSQQLAFTDGNYIAEDKFLVTVLSSNVWLIGKQDLTFSMNGNLGNTYNAPYTTFAIYNPHTKQVIDLQSAVELKQFVTVLPSTSFESFIPITRNTKQTEDNLQLKTFSLKSDLVPTRTSQQTDPVSPKPTKSDSPDIPLAEECSRLGKCPSCWGLASQQCTTYLGSSCGAGSRDPACKSCFQTQNRINVQRGACVGSPLYLYGTEDMKVNIRIHTPVYQTNPQHNGSLTAFLQKDGHMSISGKSYDSIDFNYTSALKRVTPPQKGVITHVSNIEETIRDFSKELALNEKETLDLLNYGKSISTGNYLFVSFFDHETSHAILPITFDPKPDTYRNIVFYFKNLDQKPNYSVPPPTFIPINRNGFTAIEISGMVE